MNANIEAAFAEAIAKINPSAGLYVRAPKRGVPRFVVYAKVHGKGAVEVGSVPQEIGLAKISKTDADKMAEEAVVARAELIAAL